MKMVLSMVLVSALFTMGLLLATCECDSNMVMLATKALALLLMYVAYKLSLFFEKKGLFEFED